jgi:REP element-mobilizing transposase RayT
MGYAYVIRDQGAVHFVTFTVHQWVDVFTRSKYVDILLDNLEYCQINKGLEIYAWVVMSNHCHLIVSAKDENLSDIIRDFKKYTSKAIFKAIENNKYESRREWLLKTLKYNYCHPSKLEIIKNRLFLPKLRRFPMIFKNTPLLLIE